NGDEKKQNLLMLYRMAINFEKSSFKGISSFLGYLSEIADSFSSSEKGGFENETVKIMTIHKSKGLEFDVCFVCGTGKRFNIDDMTAKFIKSRDSFYYFNVRANENLSEYVPIIKKGASIFEKQAMLCEELRCLYVAITRAKKRLYVTGCVKKAETDKNLPFFTSNSYLEWILSALDENNDSCFNLSFFDSDMNFDILSDTEKNIDDTDDCSDIGTFDYRYQFTESTKISAKVAVSELRKGIFEDDEYTRSVSGGETLAKPIFIKESVTGAERGNATHLFMQFCNFKNITQKGVEFEAKRLFDIKMITDEQFSLLNIKAIKEFFNSNLYESLKNSKKLYREKRFTLAESSDILVKGSDEQILVQGVIDCFFENSDG
ncbi:MAG: 3'-5' exonuclease, partial [Clostridia bacterium]